MYDAEVSVALCARAESDYSGLYRGRFDVDMFSDFLRLRGKTYDYKILYESIVKLYLLPKTDEIHVQFVVSIGRDIFGAHC